MSGMSGGGAGGEHGGPFREAKLRGALGGLVPVVFEGDEVGGPFAVAVGEHSVARVGGAVLDVFSEEPLPASSPFWSTPNTYITSHTSAPSFPADIVGVFVENYRRFHGGQPLLYRVEFERGY